MRKRDRRCAVGLVAAADALGDALQAEQPSRGKAADGDDQARADQAELPVAPEGAELLLAGRRRPVSPARGRLARIAARDRGAIEGGVELVLVELQPPAEGSAGPAAPRQPFNALDLS